ncbi:MAG TPA: hypothetical protein VN765_07210 [Candidatus Acidoferrum sp.]|nr:hypothetical protein [Candidatus Acidoferrum sp.]
MKPKMISGIFLVFSLIALFLIVPCKAGTITWTNTGGGLWSAATNWSPNQVPASSDDALITAGGSYTVTMDASVTVSSLTLGGANGRQILATASNNLTLNNASVVKANGILNLSGGSLDGNGLLTVNGLFNWTGGSISCTLTLATNGTLILAGQNGADYPIYNILTNAGTIELKSGNLELFANPQGQLINLPGAVVNLQADVNIDAPPQYWVGLLVNEGTLEKTGGTGTSTIYPTFNNTGLVSVQTGTVNIAGGDTVASTGVFQTASGTTLAFGNNFTLGSGVQFTGSGTNVVTANAELTLDGPMTITNLLINNGGLTVNGAVTFSNVVLGGGYLDGSGVIAGVLTWTGGSIDGTLTLATNGTLILAGANGADYPLYGILTNAGTIELKSGNLELFANSQGQLINLPGAVVNLQADVNIDAPQNWVGLLVNEGTLEKTGGTGTSTIHPTFNNTGLVSVQTGTVNIGGGDTVASTGVFQTAGGTTLAFGNNFTLGSGVQFTGSGTSEVTGGTTTLDGPMTISNLLISAGGLTVNGAVTFSNVVLGGGWLDGSGVIAGVLTWTGGSIFGTLTLATNGTLILAGQNGGDYAVQGILTNAGTIELKSGNLELFANSQGQLINLPGAVVNLQADVNIDQSWGGLLVNEGTLEKTGGTGTSIIYAAFNNTGTLNIQSGTVSLTGGYSVTNCTLIFGISSASNFGHLVLSAAFTLHATRLDAIANGYTPHAGDSFPLITYTSETGIFSAFNLPPNANWQPVYGNTAFSLNVFSLTPPFFTLQTSTSLPMTDGFTLLMLGPIGSNFMIQAATDLPTNHWVTLTNFATTDSSFYLTDTNISSRRFYRAVMH